MPTSLLRILACIVALAGMAQLAVAQQAVDYLSQVKPLLAMRCYSCHGALKHESGLRLDTAGLMLRGGEGGATIVPGDSGGSLLIKAVRGEGGLSRMPLDGEPLTDDEVSLLVRWVDQGGNAPDEPIPADPRDHWAFLSPVRPDVPQVANAGWVRNEIDAFLSAEHGRLGLTPAEEAEKHVLLRRVYVDLVGLPPTRAELHAFLADESPDAYGKVVDRLLASPQYGERWGRHWMDVWRYSDWDGYGEEIRESQRHIWRWRDWIVESVNADKPYDQMIVEMLAADELAPADPDALRATGFLARNWFKFNRNVWLENTVEHTSKALLGITLNCARCHDHKYDPIPQQAFYQFRAFFEPYDVRSDRLPGTPDVMQDGLARVFDANAAAPTYLFQRGNEALPDREHPLAPAVPEALRGASLEIQPVALPAAAYYPGLLPHVQQESQAAAQAAAEQARTELVAAQQSAAAARARLEAIVAAANGPNAPAEPPPASLFVADDFSAPRPDVWQFGAGDWQYADGSLRQSQVGDTFCQMTTAAPHPRDFSATVRFRITGGNMWRSVGLSFDATEKGDYHGVYLSAGGQKLQIFHSLGGASSYPAAGAKALDVAVDREYALRVDVREQLVNVSVDGQLLLAYQLPQSRQEGRFALWAFDATSEFVGVTIEELSTQAPLVASDGGAAPTPAPVTPEQAQTALTAAEATVTLADKQAALADADAAAVAARIAADNARYATPPAADAESLAQAAGAAEAKAAVVRAEIALATAEQQRAAAQAALDEGNEATKQAQADAELGLEKARVILEAARAAADAPPASYAPLTTVYPAESSGRRLALARWIADRENPLTARVAVNHIWMRHFGEGLVTSTFDFGLNGRRPTHPALLDWLAVEFMDRGWSMKHLHRLMVASAAYRMASSGGEGSNAQANAAADPDNVYLWRMRTRRAEAEVIRDSVLAVAGSLDATRGGADLDHALALGVPRRSIYFRHAKEKRAVFMQLFDAASVAECYRRNESIVPQQALALANSPLALAQARLLASRLTEEVGAAAEADEAFVAAAFEQVLSRAATAEERAECLAFVGRQAERFFAGGLTAFASGPSAGVPPSADPRQRARENLVHVLLNHNDFVTIR